MKSSKQLPKVNADLRETPKSCTFIEQVNHSPKLNDVPKLWSSLKKSDQLPSARTLMKQPRERVSASESNLPLKDVEIEELSRVEKDGPHGDDKSLVTLSSKMQRQKIVEGLEIKKLQGIWKNDKARKCYGYENLPKKSRPRSPSPAEDALTRQIRDIHTETRKSARIIRDSRARLLEIQKKTPLLESDIKEVGERNELLLREMERFDKLTKNIQKLVSEDISQKKRSKEQCQQRDYTASIYDSPEYHEMSIDNPTIFLGCCKNSSTITSDQPIRSKSEIDLSRKLSESYDMQEKLVADNADLEVKRYILYKELMTKDQNLETCRAQIKRLQGELKLMNKENVILHERLNRNSPEGDAIAVSPDPSNDENINIYTQEHQLGGLEAEVRNIRVEMADVKAAAATACRGGGAQNTCFQQPCGVCPPCPAPCNPNAPPTPAEREVQKLSLQLHQTEESLKTKITECAMLRTELLKKKEELEKERCQHREVQNKLRELEMKFEGLTTHTNMMLGTKEQAFEQEVNVRALKQCYREAREEIDELRTLMKEQNNQLQDYRVKYLQAQQLVEEQRRQMDMMDMDNTRISEQINLEIQRVKLKFQEKLQELAPIPDLLKATQMKLKDAQQSQAIAEHNAEQLARELNSAREKVHVLLHNSLKQPEKPPERGADEKQMALLQQRISQLTETNMSLKSEIERLKANVIRMEESVLANEKRLQEKMHECAQLGGELDRARDEAARALQRANERTDTIRKCMQTTVGELERQLASTRAQVKTAEKDQEELQCRMQCQIKRLNENFEQAQLRILGLQAQVQTLRRTVSSTGDGEGDMQECACKSMFDDP
ncbi:unnamed protein product, partial [Brenthis ino]